jgi:choice-of-anchor A domain-containing protein
VVLAGGVLPENVLFNVMNTGLDQSMSAAAQFSGVILAPSRTINLSGASNALGTIVAGKVNISGGSTVNHPPFVSP